MKIWASMHNSATPMTILSLYGCFCWCSQQL